jgi:hypothetical protein
MAVEPIQVDAEDEVPAIIERIRRTPADEVHLVLPARSRFGQSRFNFQLLKQYTTRLGKRVAVVSADPSVQRFAEESGFGALGPPSPRFEGDGRAVLPLSPPGVDRQRGGAGMRPGSIRPPYPGGDRLEGQGMIPPPPRGLAGGPPPGPFLPAGGARIVGQPVRSAAVQAPTRIRVGPPRRLPALIGSQETTRLLLYTGAGILALFAMFVLAFVVPSAHITLVVKAAPFSTGVDALAQPGKPPIRVRTVTIAKQDSLSAQATGQKSIGGQYAIGQVTYANNCTQELMIPNGQRLRAVTGMIFAQIGEQRVPQGGAATVNVRATQTGQAGNVGAGQITTLEPNSFNCLTAANAQATAGGADDQKQTVIQSSDFQSVRAQLEQKLRQQVLDELNHGGQQGETLVKDPVWKTDDFSTTHQVDDNVPNFTGTLKLEAEGDYYMTEDVNQVFARSLAGKVRSDQELTANPVTTSYAVTASGNGQLEFSGTASGYVTNKIDTERVKGQLVGKTGGAARSILDALPVTRAEIVQSPFPLPLMPLTTSHITVDYAVDQVLPPTKSG